MSQTEKKEPSPVLDQDRDLRPAIDAKRFFELSPSLYRGAVPSEQDLRALKMWGIKSIVDFQMTPDPNEERITAELGIKYYDIPWTAHLNKAMSFHYIHEVTLKFLGLLADRANLPIYVHCFHGRERTGTMIAVYRMAIENWSYERARDEMLSFGVNKWIHFNLFVYLKRFRKFLDKNPTFSDRIHLPGNSESGQGTA